MDAIDEVRERLHNELRPVVVKQDVSSRDKGKREEQEKSVKKGDPSFPITWWKR